MRRAADGDCVWQHDAANKLQDSAAGDGGAADRRAQSVIALGLEDPGADRCRPAVGISARENQRARAGLGEGVLAADRRRVCQCAAGDSKGLRGREGDRQRDRRGAHAVRGRDAVGEIDAHAGDIVTCPGDGDAVERHGREVVVIRLSRDIRRENKARTGRRYGIAAQLSADDQLLLLASPPLQVKVGDRNRRHRQNDIVRTCRPRK